VAAGALAWSGSSVHMAACGVCHLIVLASDGAVWTCGECSDGELGLGDLLDRWVPTCLAPEVFDGAEIVFVAGGLEVSYAVTVEGILYAWGAEFAGAGPLVQTPPPQTRPVPVASSLVPGARVGRSCALPRRHSLALSMGAHSRLGQASPLSSAPREVLDAVLAQAARLGGDYLHMGEGLLRRLAVRARRT